MNNSSVNVLPGDPDNGAVGHTSDSRRNELLWLALLLVGFLALAFVLLVAYGQEIASADYGEPLLLIGLLAFLACTVAYFGDRERQYRAENRSLIQQLHDSTEVLDARVARLRGLCETSTNLLGALGVDRIMEFVVDTLVVQVGTDAAAFVLVNKATKQCLKTVSAGPLAQVETESARLAAIAAEALDQPCPSVRLLASRAGSAQPTQAPGGGRYVICAPIQVSSVLAGGLAAARCGQFDAEEVSLLDTLVNMAAKAIETADLNQQLRGCYFRTLQVLSRSLAARDPYSAVHGEAVTWLACRLALALEMGSGDMHALEEYGPLHDLGKVGIPDSVLLKEEALTQEELEMCRQHTVIGETMIQPFTTDPRVLSMVRSHHERWDGTGYPDGLKGEQAHILARILAVADAFHAIVSCRPYRGGAIPSEALHEIRALSGTHFDPKVVQALVELWDKGELAKFIVRFGPSDNTTQ